MCVGMVFWVQLYLCASDWVSEWVFADFSVLKIQTQTEYCPKKHYEPYASFENQLYLHSDRSR